MPVIKTLYSKKFEKDLLVYHITLDGSDTEIRIHDEQLANRIIRALYIAEQIGYRNIVDKLSEIVDEELASVRKK